MPLSITQNYETEKVICCQHLGVPSAQRYTDLPLFLPFAPVAAPATAKPVLVAALHPLVKGAYQITDTATGRPFGGAFTAAEAEWIVARFSDCAPGVAISPAAFGAVAERAIARFKPNNEVSHG